MTPIGWLSLLFAGIALTSLLALVILTAGENVRIGNWLGWWHMRKAEKRRRAQRLALPKAYLIAPDSYEVVSLASVVSRRVK